MRRNLIEHTARRGVFTSEFWLSLAAMASPYVATETVGTMDGAPWWAAVVVAVSNAVIAAAYAIGRAIDKRKLADVAPSYDGGYVQGGGA